MKLTKRTDFFYPFVVRRVVDGDTVYGDVVLKEVYADLGFGVIDEQTITKYIKVRLHGINTPELHGSEKERGLEAKSALINKLKHTDGGMYKPCRIETVKNKQGKFGRWLGVLWVGGDPVSLNTWLVDQGYAEKKEY